MIYQVENGGDNNNKLPLGGVIVQNYSASSMMATIANPITFYLSSVINQEGHSGDLYNYYWTSYSRGADGQGSNTNWHNAYLDGYIPLRVKSIYDPCPYLYRIPSNGTFNQFTSNAGWTYNSYLGGVSSNINGGENYWLTASGRRSNNGLMESIGGGVGIRNATKQAIAQAYIIYFQNDGRIQYNGNWGLPSGTSVRCIEVTRRYAHTFCQQKVCKNCRAS